METPIATTKTIPEFNKIIVTLFKEFPEFVRDGCWMNLIGVWWRIKNCFGSINRVCDDDNLFDVGKMGRLVNITSYFHFSWHDIYCVMNHLDNWTIIVWTYTIKVATQFLILVSNSTTTIYESDDAWRVMFSRLCIWFLMLFLLFLFK